MADEQQFTEQFFKGLRKAAVETVEDPKTKKPSVTVTEGDPHAPSVLDRMGTLSRYRKSSNVNINYNPVPADPESLFPPRKEADTSSTIEISLPSTSKKVGKSSNPDYERLMVLVQKKTRKTAARKWEDEQPDADFSDLIEQLLRAYNSGQTSI